MLDPKNITHLYDATLHPATKANVVGSIPDYDNRSVGVPSLRKTFYIHIDQIERIIMLSVIK